MLGEVGDEPDLSHRERNPTLRGDDGRENPSPRHHGSPRSLPQIDDHQSSPPHLHTQVVKGHGGMGKHEIGAAGTPHEHRGAEATRSECSTPQLDLDLHPHPVTLRHRC